MIRVSIVGDVLPEEDIDRYIQYLEEKYNRKLDELHLEFSGDYVDMTYKFAPVPFERIRRITGYLTGDTSTWNDAKQHELEDRVVHGGIEQL